MDVYISVDFGQGYRVSLTPVDARKLFDQLKPLFESQPSMSLTTSTSGALWNTLGLNTVPEMPAEFTPGPFLTGLNTQPNVDKMASELEAKVRAEMDKQGLGSEAVPCTDPEHPCERWS